MSPIPAPWGVHYITRANGSSHQWWLQIIDLLLLSNRGWCKVSYSIAPHFDYWMALYCFIANGFTSALQQWIITEGRPTRESTPNYGFSSANCFVCCGYPCMSFLYLTVVQSPLSNAEPKLSITNIYCIRQWPCLSRHLDFSITWYVKWNHSTERLILSEVFYTRRQQRRRRSWHVWALKACLMPSSPMIVTLCCLVHILSSKSEWYGGSHLFTKLYMTISDHIYLSWNIKKDKDNVRMYNF